jgi:hypothetical protein
MRSDPIATATNYATGDPRRIEVPMVDFNSDGGNIGGSTVSVHGFAVLWLTSVDAKGSISGEFLDFVPGSEFSRKEGGPGTLRRWFCTCRGGHLVLSVKLTSQHE